MLVITLAACGGGTSSNTNGGNGGNGGTEYDVVMQNTSFSPDELTVSAGTSVSWVNRDGFDHTVTSGTPGNPDGAFDSGTIGPDGTYSRSFSQADTVEYYCSIHGDNMTAVIIVE